MTDGQIDDPDAGLGEANWSPTRASTTLALVATAGSVAALTAAVGVRTGALVAGAGAVCLAVAVRLLAVDRWQVPATLAASLLLVPAGAGVAAGVGYEFVVAFAASFPAASQTGVVGQSLRIVGVLAVLWGSTLAVFGAVASIRGDLTGRSVRRTRDLAAGVALPSVTAFVALAGRALVENVASGAAGVPGELLGNAVDWLVAPAPDRLGALGFGVLFAAACFAVHRAVRTLPLRALAGGATVGDVEAVELVAALERTTNRLLVVTVLWLLAGLFVFLFEEAGVAREVIPGAAYGPLVELTTAAGLRRALVGIALVAGAVAVSAALARRFSRVSVREVLADYAPLVAGLGVLAGVFAVHGAVRRALVGFVAGRLDRPLAGRVREVADGVVTFYGSETVVLGLVAGVLVLAALALFALSLWFLFGFVGDRAAGTALAGTGLFAAAAFAGTVGAPLWVLLGGLVAGLVVRDVGAFGATLGAEVGRRGMRSRVEPLHGLASVGVGGLAALAAARLAGVTATDWVGVDSGGTFTAVAVALVGAVAAVVLLVLALR
ncbi:hypothetical protein [Halorussus halobius]|uniref:hypothetical protein n=1 Tax=Halorussus halobius TaxID=1710537 RepID=UPI001092D1F4|nr:hypothetical protein [Halorussus halobius]